MGYAIQYGSYKYDSKRMGKTKIKIIAAISVLALCILICLCFPEQVSMVRKWCFPFLESDVVDDFEQMMLKVEQGEAFSDAAAAFCREIIDQSSY